MADSCYAGDADSIVEKAQAAETEGQSVDEETENGFYFILHVFGLFG